MKPLFALLLLAAPVVDAAEAHAQAPARWSFGAALGAGPHPGQVGEVYYGSSRSNSGQLALSYRPGAGAVRPLVRAELLSEGPGSDWDDCPRAPNGSCRRDFPAPDGLGGAAGVSWAPMPRVELGALAGIGRYDGTMRRFLEVDAAVAITRRLSATGAFRRMTWHEPDLGRLWYRPVHFGLATHW